MAKKKRKKKKSRRKTGAQVFGVPAAVLSLPKSMRAGAAPEAIADVLELPTSKRQVEPKRSGRALARWGGEWKVGDLGKLFRRDRRFGSLVIFSITDFGDKERDPVTKKEVEIKNEATYLALAYKVIREKPDRYIGLANAVLTNIANVVNDLKIHPSDFATMIVTAAGNDDAAIRKGKLSIYKSAQREINRILPQDSGDPMMVIGRTFKRSLRGISSSRSAVMQEAARAVRAFSNTLFKGFFQRRGLKPWSNSSGTRNVMGIEVIGFSYLIPQKFGEDGEAIMDGAHEVSHATAATVAELRASDPGELKGTLGMTPAGRLWLCADGKQRGLFLATDRQPGRQLFLVRKESKNDAALHGKDIQSLVSGFTV